MIFIVIGEVKTWILMNNDFPLCQVMIGGPVVNPVLCLILRYSMTYDL